jgi:hypothetical protein
VSGSDQQVKWFVYNTIEVQMVYDYEILKLHTQLGLPVDDISVHQCSECIFTEFCMIYYSTSFII